MQPLADPQVAVSLLAPAGEGRMQLGPGESARGGRPDPQRMPMPTYPPAWIERDPGPVEVSARVIVDSLGRLEPPQLAAAGPSCIDACVEAISTATAEALTRWNFEPLEILGWVDGPDADGDGQPDTVRRGVVDSRPYTLRLRFDFSLVEGQPRVGLSEPHR